MKFFQPQESRNQISAASILRAFSFIAILFALSFQSAKAQITVPCIDVKGAHVTNISIAPNPSDTELRLTADNGFDMKNVHFTSVSTATEVWNASVQGTNVQLNVSALAEDNYTLFIESQGGVGCKIDEIIVISHN
jgi:hypothetical protein